MPVSHEVNVLPKSQCFKCLIEMIDGFPKDRMVPSMLTWNWEKENTFLFVIQTFQRWLNLTCSLERDSVEAMTLFTWDMQISAIKSVRK